MPAFRTGTPSATPSRLVKVTSDGTPSPEVMLSPRNTTPCRVGSTARRTSPPDHATYAVALTSRTRAPLTAHRRGRRSDPPAVRLTSGDISRRPHYRRGRPGCQGSDEAVDRPCRAGPVGLPFGLRAGARRAHQPGGHRWHAADPSRIVGSVGARYSRAGWRWEGA